MLSAQPSATPFMRHEYLAALHDSGSAADDTGWPPQFLAVEPAAQLVAACPLYLKTHSYGEYVFDWAWADAYQRHGLRYYPKLLGAVPFTPVPGPRLLARDADARAPCCCRRCSSSRARPSCPRLHLLFLDEADRAAAGAAGWMLRTRVQFHWRNREPRPTPTSPTSSPACSATSARRSSRSGAAWRGRRHASTRCTAREIAAADWDFFYRCYTRTYRAHHSTPYLTRDFFARMAATMPRALADVRRASARRADRRLADRDRPGARPRLRPLLGRDRARAAACTSRPATTSRSPGASSTATAASRAARKASTRWRAACCRCRRTRRTGSRTRSSPMRWALPGARRRRRRAYLDELNERSPFKAAPARPVGLCRPLARGRLSPFVAPTIAFSIPLRPRTSWSSR